MTSGLLERKSHTVRRETCAGSRNGCATAQHPTTGWIVHPVQECVASCRRVHRDRRPAAKKHRVDREQGPASWHFPRSLIGNGRLDLIVIAGLDPAIQQPRAALSQPAVVTGFPLSRE